MRRAFFPLLSLAVLLAACAETPKPSPPRVLKQPPQAVPQVPAKVQIRARTFSALNGWAEDRHGDALKAFQKSCAKLMTLPKTRHLAVNDAVPSGTVQDWTQACRAAKGLSVTDHRGAKHFFELWFVPYEVKDPSAGNGLFTGYYEPELKGSWTREGPYQTPLLARPDDLVSVNIGSFDKNLGGNTIWGRVVNGRLRAYPNRSAIEQGQLGSLGHPIMWVDSQVDAFFLHIQGSGRIKLANGQVARVGFAGKNGQTYKSVGRILINSGEIPANRLTMNAIRNWVDSHPVEGSKLLQKNPSYIFFRILTGDGPIGAQGVSLTAGRSLAVDRRFLPLGAPLWLETRDPLRKNTPFNHLMVAQD
ncbi:MAG: murein transglycosylase A, partial [Magnetovibrio sp.]|nr:murein transglycosylase A [Magnetovibrio sp.]